MAATTWLLLLSVLFGSVWAQTPCDTPDVVRSRCNCNGLPYDFSQMKDAVTGSTCVILLLFPDLVGLHSQGFSPSFLHQCRPTSSSINGTLFLIFRFPKAHTDRLFQGANDGYNYYFEMVNNGLPSSFTGCSFDPSLAVGNAVSRRSDAFLCPSMLVSLP